VGFVLERLQQGIQQGRELRAQVLASLSPQQKTFLTRGLPILLLCVGLGVYWLNHVYYRPLFTNLSAQDAAAVVKELDAQKIPYQLSKEGSVIEVPEDMVYRTRLDLAGKGLPQGGGVGLEFFEHTQFGLSEFTQRVNYTRALQGELVRTISALAAVQSCRVHLALPEHGNFHRAEEKSSASVVVDLRPGFRLSPAQVHGIVNLVSTSVPGLSPERVTVVDSSGKLLQSSEEKEEKSATEMLYQLTREREHEIEQRIESMLDPVLGPGRAVARVAVELEAREMQRTREEYDPAGVERSKQLEVEETANPGGAVAGVQANITNGDTGKTPSESPIKKSSQVYNYEIGKTTSQTIEPRGQMRRLTVGVLIDGRYQGETYIPRSAEEIDAVRSVVMMAAGISNERGDKVEIVNIPFKTKPVDPDKENVPFNPQQWVKTPQGMGSVGGVVVLLVLMMLLGRRRGAKAKRMAEGQRVLEQAAGQDGVVQLGEAGAVLSQPGQLDQAGNPLPLGAPQEVFQLTEGGPAVAVEKIKVLSDPRREELVKIAAAHKELMVQIVRDWLNEEKLRIKAARTAKPAEAS
jgi:flagellar M-ring protein FliF